MNHRKTTNLLMFFKRFPGEYQMDSQDCGPASLKIRAKYHGLYYFLQMLHDRCGLSRTGLTLLDISHGSDSIVGFYHTIQLEVSGEKSEIT